MKFYNNERLHGALKRVPPMKKWNEYYLNLSSDKPTTAQVSEEMSRVSNGADNGLALDISGDTANFANRMMNENQAENKRNNLNCFQKNVQLIGG